VPPCTTTFTDSQSFNESGSEDAQDPQGGPDSGGSLTEVSLTTSFVYSANQGVETLGPGGTISNGVNDFTLDECNSDSHSISVTTSGNIVVDDGCDYYSLHMQGSESLGAGGVVTGGSDSYTWVQWASDAFGLTEAQGSDSESLDAYTDYQINLTDTISNSFSDVGADILGTSDSILGGSDTYSWMQMRSVSSAEVDSGDSATPYYVSACGSDYSQLSDQGSSTLTTDGHIHSTDTYSFTEDSTDYALDSHSISGPSDGSVSTGEAHDTYSETVTGTMTVSDSTTTSLDTFELGNTHSMGWALSST
jgi:trimeric autotransporter adhesin